jgi:hypothetical protein
MAFFVIIVIASAEFSNTIASGRGIGPEEGMRSGPHLAVAASTFLEFSGSKQFFPFHQINSPKIPGEDGGR